MFELCFVAGGFFQNPSMLNLYEDELLALSHKPVRVFRFPWFKPIKWAIGQQAAPPFLFLPQWRRLLDKQILVRPCGNVRLESNLHHLSLFFDKLFVYFG